MKPDDPNIAWIDEPKLGLAGKMYLPLFVQGFATTTKHLFGPKVTVSFPEDRPKIGEPLIYRGVHRLNREGIRAPRGKDWRPSTLIGNAQRGSGILNNELYVGRLVWNKVRMVKDLDTGKRLSRANPRDERQVLRGAMRPD